MNRVAAILGIKYPFVQGAMSWLTDAKFVAAVSNAGGMGILGPNAGAHTVTPSADETAKRMREQVKQTQALTDKPFAVTLIVAGGEASIFTKKILDVVIEEHVPAVLLNSLGGVSSDTYGVDPATMKTLKNHGIKTIVRSLQPSIEDAQAVEKQGADVYVATGFDEGGTMPGGEIGSFAIMPMIADAVKIPVLLAGGIADSRTVNAAFALGAEGVYVGSRLIPTTENPAAENVKQLIVHSNAEDLTLFRTLPDYYRSLPTKLVDQLAENDRTLPAVEAKKANAKLMGGTSGMRIGMLDGDLEHGYVSVGTGISMVHSIQPVKEVIDEMMADYDKNAK
ncbi:MULTISPECIES: nitronate monooxygenase family protein [unclassified Lacticaseibacillus]|uniref:NAD(P)H-dependent flavin oxidoreductase n=1 Tax=unclassified Lacticaseibacillus TaxID=2759744 RepID=UPI001941231B|nr:MULTISPECIES: nitronate monooxygenase [unclassified Lacticaseibacillus]